jgi:hypothetical protein
LLNQLLVITAIFVVCIICRDHAAQGDALLNRNRDAIIRKKITGGVIDSGSLRTLKEKRDFFYPFSLILHNTKPVGHQVFFLSSHL